jgi:uncharacterized protein YndB with AHSA1/START domain
MIPLPHDTTTLVLRRTFTAPRQRVFRAWTEPQALQNWFRPRGLKMTIRKLDVQVGGSFHFDLGDGNSIVGTYLHIAPPEKLVLTWSGEAIQGHETIVTLDFLDQGPVTEVVLTHERLNTPELLTMFGSGWSDVLDALAEVLSTNLAF